ncbi:oligosaccharide flippase family protein [Pelomonas sp. KK5]|uniref:oligosaccharide flippase family protein n=1 Tax=Pelomonas sp. KK5 TaxID=1855730 RepID=UPI00097C2145|nr:oligosaccharide flippase family protein [Pelomonas sp. KK5]
MTIADTPVVAAAKPDDDSRGRVRRSLIWSTVENLGLLLISFGTLVLYSHVLTAAEFGLFSMVLALIELVDVLIRMLFHDALIQREQADAMHFDTAFTTTLGLGLLALGLCVAGAPLFERLVDAPGAGRVLAWTALALPFGAWTATIVAHQRRELSFKALALRSLMGRMTGAVVGLALVYAGAGVWGLVAQQVLIVGIGSCVLWWTAAQRPQLRFSMQALRDLAGFGASAVVTQLLTFAVKRIFTIMAGAMLGLAAAGLLNLAMRVVDTLYSVAATAVSQVAMPMLSALRGDPARMVRVYRLATAVTCAMLYGLMIGLAVTAPEVVQLVFGPRWSEASLYITVLACLPLLQGPRVLMNPLLSAIGRPGDPLIARGVEFAFLLAAMWLLPQRTLPWVLGVWLAREALGFPIMLWLVRRGAGIRLADQLRGVVTPLVAAAVMVAAVLAARAHFSLPALPQLALLVVVGAASFIGTLLLIDRALLREVLQLAKSKVAK